MKTVIIEGGRFSGIGVMLSKYGDVYTGVQGQYHPYPGRRADRYSEIDECINWLCQNNIASSVSSEIDEWLRINIANILTYQGDMSYQDLMGEVFPTMYEGDTCKELERRFQNAYDEIQSLSDEETMMWTEKNILEPADKIASFINEKFLRVREGGKYNYDGESAIYFRISSHGYDWHRNIVEYLWDMYGSINKMPERIWIGHDGESNPPETVLFDGTPEELLNHDDYKVYEDLKVMSSNSRNRDREASIKNRFYYKTFDKYTPFR